MCRLYATARKLPKCGREDDDAEENEQDADVPRRALGALASANELGREVRVGRGRRHDAEGGAGEKRHVPGLGEAGGEVHAVEGNERQHAELEERDEGPSRRREIRQSGQVFTEQRPRGVARQVARLEERQRRAEERAGQVQRVAEDGSEDDATDDGEDRPRERHGDGDGVERHVREGGPWPLGFSAETKGPLLKVRTDGREAGDQHAADDERREEAEPKDGMSSHVDKIGPGAGGESGA
jgi:hypothetical protein